MTSTTTRTTGRRRSSIALVALPCVLALALGGCSSSGDGDRERAPTSTSVTPTPDATAETTPDPTAEPTEPADGIVDLSDEATGIVFTNLPDVTGDEAAVLNAYQAYEIERWAARRNTVVSASAHEVTTELGYLELLDVVEYLASVQATISGTITLSPTLEMLEGDTAAVGGCGDESAAVAQVPEGTVPVAGPNGMTTYRMQVNLRLEADRWKVESYEGLEELCTV